MNDILNTTLVFISGLALGTLFFGGLWLTVKKSVASKTPALWILGSFAVRTAITLLGFYFIGAGNMQRMLICLLGFIAARFVVIYFTKRDKANQIRLKVETNHEA